ncbi:Glucosamine-6-phosphate isomerase (Glucosamine-6-phosphate deaminase) (GNPDA) (GlcN6P deaminase), partial [Linderina macrospora]
MKITASAIGLLAALPSVLGVWPLPRTLQEGCDNTQVWWASIYANGTVGPIVNSAIVRYQDIINKESFTAPVNYKQGVIDTKGTFMGLQVSVENLDDTLNLETDESYTLDIPTDGMASLKAKTPYGA